MRTLSIIFLLGLSACANSETCPAQEDLQPCHCRKFDDDNIVVLCLREPVDIHGLKKSISSLVGKKDVEFELVELNIGTVPSDFFVGIEVVRLKFSSCVLDSLTEDESLPALHGLEDSLRRLYITGSFTEENVLVKLKLGHLKKLESLDLSSNTITELGDDWFDKGFASLEYLELYYNKIEKLGDRAFANLVNLKELTLVGNRFGSVKRSMLPTSAEKLVTLTLESNALTSLPEDIFSNMPSLDYVSLRSNGIARLEQRTWEPLWQQLDAIYLESNPLECDSHMTWMFDLRVTSAIYGTCEAPKDKRGIKLQKFIDDKGQ